VSEPVELNGKWEMKRRTKMKENLSEGIQRRYGEKR
jgi:hypothetical protein